jgi:hypothetical protein
VEPWRSVEGPPGQARARAEDESLTEGQALGRSKKHGRYDSKQSHLRRAKYYYDSLPRCYRDRAIKLVELRWKNGNECTHREGGLRDRGNRKWSRKRGLQLGLGSLNIASLGSGEQDTRSHKATYEPATRNWNPPWQLRTHPITLGAGSGHRQNLQRKAPIGWGEQRGTGKRTGAYRWRDRGGWLVGPELCPRATAPSRSNTY